MFQKLPVFTGFSLVAFSSDELKPSRSLWCYFWHNRDTDTTCISILCDIPENILLKGWSANLFFFFCGYQNTYLLFGTLVIDFRNIFRGEGGLKISGFILFQIIFPVTAIYDWNILGILQP